MEQEDKELTHGDSVDLRVIGHIIVFIEVCFPECQRSTNGWRELWALTCCGKMGIDMIHCGNHGRKVWRRPRKEQGRVLE